MRMVLKETNIWMNRQIKPILPQHSKQSQSKQLKYKGWETNEQRGWRRLSIIYLCIYLSVYQLPVQLSICLSVYFSLSLWNIQCFMSLRYESSWFLDTTEFPGFTSSQWKPLCPHTQLISCLDEIATYIYVCILLCFSGKFWLIKQLKYVLVFGEYICLFGYFSRSISINET